MSQAHRAAGDGWALGRPMPTLPHHTPAERLANAIALSRPYAPSDRPTVTVAAGDDICTRCGDGARWYGELGAREPVHLWQCGCGEQWTTAVRRAEAQR